MTHREYINTLLNRLLKLTDDDYEIIVMFDDQVLSKDDVIITKSTTIIDGVVVVDDIGYEDWTSLRRELKLEMKKRIRVLRELDLDSFITK